MTEFFKPTTKQLNLAASNIAPIAPVNAGKSGTGKDTSAKAKFLGDASSDVGAHGDNVGNSTKNTATVFPGATSKVI